MKNNSTMKALGVVALVISLVGISLGFAAYSNTLTIKATADYTGGIPTPIAQLSTSSSSVTAGNVTPTVTGATAGAASLTATTIQNISVHFTATNQRAVYSFYAVNPSSFVSYLNSVVFGTKTCTPGTGTTASYVANACNDITMSVEVGSDEFIETNNNINSHTLNGGASEPVKVTIEYIDGGALADGDFTVDFGTSSLNYSTVD